MSIAALIVASLTLVKPAVANPDGPGCGQLYIVGDRTSVPMPLKHTSVEANIGGIGARVTVRQQFSNPSRTPIEAVYTFPLPHDAAVDRMTIRIGDRVIEGQIKERGEARRIYEAAKAQGQVAALLDQERPNIFTQSVANIMPGNGIDVEISYVQTLKYDDGQYEFVFPMVVGPRFMPSGTKDPAKIAPPVTPPGTRSGQTISLKVNLDAGAPIRQMASVLHRIDTRDMGAERRIITLRKRDEIPNRDFILRYRVATDTVTSQVLTQYDTKHGGHLALILLPPKEPSHAQIRPKEVIFVMDQSGSQSGFPIEKSKELTLKLIKTLRPNDTFNVLGFNTSVRSLWDAPRPNNRANIAEAETFVSAMQANGGTMIREGVVAALANQNDSRRLRIVLFNTDGFVGDEPLVLKAIEENRSRARMFVFGIGNSVNRYLIEGMSEQGRGASEIVTLNEDADKAVTRFVKRLETPVLTDVSLSIDGVTIHDQEPTALPDVFDNTPVIVYGRYDKPGTGTVTLSGKVGDRPWSQTLRLNLTVQPGAPSIPTLWARRQIESIERANFLHQYMNASRETPRDKILELALDYGIMSTYTSFVAVDQRVVNFGGRTRKIRVPVEMPDGVSYEGIFGNRRDVFGRNVYGRSRLGRSVGGLGGGMGGGGFGGGSAKGTVQENLSIGQPSAPGSISYMNADPSDNSLVVARLKPEAKIDKALLKKKGAVDVEILVTDLKDANLKKLKALGFKLAEKDGSLRIVYGTIDASKLMALAKLDFVEKIRPVE